MNTTTDLGNDPKSELSRYMSELGKKGGKRSQSLRTPEQKAAHSRMMHEAKKQKGKGLDNG